MAKSPKTTPAESKPEAPAEKARAAVKEMFSYSEHPNRTLIIGAIGAVLGLALAGFGLFTAKGTRVRTVPPEAVAMVNGRPVLISDYVAQVEAEMGVQYNAATDAQRAKVLQEMISEELFVQRGLEIDEPSVDPDVRSALVSAVQTQVAVDAVTKSPSDEELREFYDANKAEYSSMGLLTVKDLAGPSGTDPALAMRNAQAAAAALRAGQGLDAVAARYNLKDTGRVSGEELYFAAQIHLGDALFAKASTMKSGEVSDPIQQADGPHVLAVVSNFPPVARDFEDSRIQVLTDYKQGLQARMQANEDKFLRERADILVAKAFQKLADQK